MKSKNLNITNDSWQRAGFAEIDATNPKDKVWHYMDFSKFIYALDKNAIFFSRLDKLNDKYEGYLPDYHTKDNLTSEQKTEAEDITEKFLNCKTDLGLYYLIYDLCPFHSKENINYLIKELSCLKEKNDYEGIKENVLTKILIFNKNEGIKNARKFSLVNCWHLNEFESESMWNLYSSMQEGIAIKSSIERLQKYLTGLNKYRDNNKFTVESRKVLYKDLKELPELSGKEDFLPRFFIKRPRFKYENEYRIIICNCNYDDNPWQQKPGEYIKSDLNSLIEAIYISPNAPYWFTDGNIIKSVLSRYGYQKLVDKVMTTDIDDIKTK